jgi:hypothetical protein
MSSHASARLPHYRTSDLSEFRNRRVTGRALTLRACTLVVHAYILLLVPDESGKLLALTVEVGPRRIVGLENAVRGLITKCMRTHTHSDNFPATNSPTTRLGHRLATGLDRCRCQSTTLAASSSQIYYCRLLGKC